MDVYNNNINYQPLSNEELHMIDGGGWRDTAGTIAGAAVAGGLAFALGGGSLLIFGATMAATTFFVEPRRVE